MNPSKYVGAGLKALTKSLAHGEITAMPFGKEGCPVSIFLAPKSGTTAVPYTFANCKLHLDNTASDLPIKIGEWSEPQVVFLTDHSINTTLLSDYRVFWTSGEEVPV